VGLFKVSSLRFAICYLLFVGQLEMKNAKYQIANIK
jgi:hypothetical protein